MVISPRVTNKFYVPGEERASKVQDLFAAIAPRYDFINDLQSFGMHRLWKKRLLAMAQGKPGESVLDLCCGTGDIAIAFAKKGLDTVGLDFSPAMLSVAEQRAKKLSASSSLKSHADRMGSNRRDLNSDGKHNTVHLLPGGLEPFGKRRKEFGEAGGPHGPSEREVRESLGRDEGERSDQASNPRFIQGDALHLPFPDATFDIVTIGYGLRNLADFDAGLREMQRVTRKGGRLLILDFGKPDNATLRALYFFYLRRCVPLLGRIFCGDFDTHAYILESLINYAAQRGVDSRLRELGFIDTRIINLLGGMMSINYGVKAR